jgi:kynurenine formamidase
MDMPRELDALAAAAGRLASTLADYRMIDLTRLLEPGIPTYPTHPKYFKMRWCSMGDPAEMSQLIMSEHTGTHLDAPSHFVPRLDDPARKHVHELPLETFLGRCVKLGFGPFEKNNSVVGLAEVRAWERDHVAIERGDVVLIDFGWERHWTTGTDGFGFLDSWPGLARDAAEYLRDKRVKLVGTDCISLDPGNGGDGLPAHYTLLPEGVLILENVSRLNALPPVSYFMAMPLKIAQGSGSPVRAIAFVPC